jgi:hypothetical protein
MCGNASFLTPIEPNDAGALIPAIPGETSQRSPTICPAQQDPHPEQLVPGATSSSKPEEKPNHSIRRGCVYRE